MKLNNTLIVTLPDFARHFDFAEFWDNRRQFVRDMSPQKVYYWNEQLRKAYNDVSEWIEKGDHATDDDCKAGLTALRMLVGREIDVHGVCGNGQAVDFSADILRVGVGDVLQLPAYSNNGNGGGITLRHCKIEAVGNSMSAKATVRIGKSGGVEMAAGEFVYATAVGGEFVEFLPNRERNRRYDLRLVSDKGKFESRLYVRDLATNQTHVVDGVCSFTLVDDGYLYVDKKKRPVFKSAGMKALQYFFLHAGSAFCVKSDGKDVLVVYEDAKMRSSLGLDTVEGVVGAEFAGHGKIKTF